jgi:hypothetical protein
MPRILRHASTVFRSTVYLLLGISGVAALVHGQPVGWIAVAFSTAAIGLRILNMFFRRRQAKLVASETARSAEPGYIAPIFDPTEWNRLRTRNLRIVVLGFIAPCLAVGITATWIALASTSDLQTWALVIALSMLISAGVSVFAMRRSLRQVRDDA